MLKPSDKLWVISLAGINGWSLLRAIGNPKFC